MNNHDERVRFSDTDSLISTTTPESNITYCNEDFYHVAGYNEQELLGQPHNLIRHQDMPKEAFAQLWQYIQSGNSWMGLVKNKCKDKGHYWVSAFVTPIRNSDGSVHEYQSVRTQPNDGQIERAKALYAQMHAGKVKVRRMRWLLSSYVLLGLQALLGLALIAGVIPTTMAAIALLTTILAQAGCAVMFKQRLSTIHKLAKEHYDNPIMEKPYTGYCDDLSPIELAMQMKSAELRAVTSRASETSTDLIDSAKQELANRQSIDNELGEQDLATDAMAVSAEEMLASIDEVAHQAKQSADFAINAQDQAQQGASTVEEAAQTVHELSEHLTGSKSALEQLYNDVDGIEAILSMIQGIAEQTNLLALNAAIEAARAGEQGRGFAVVADEVRALSGKTSSSVEEIRSRIEILQNTVKQTGRFIEEGIHSSEVCVEKSQQSRASFEAIVKDLISINEQSAQTSQAIEEQVQVTHGINDHVVRVKQAIIETRELSSTSVTRAESLATHLQSLKRLVNQFNH